MNKKMSSWVMIASAAIAACTVSEDVSDGRGTPVQVPLNPYVGRLVSVDVAVEGETARLLFDTGGGETLISPEVARRIGCDPTGRTAGFRMSGERVDFQLCYDVTVSIGGLEFEHEQLGVWDINAILPEGVPPIDGLLSLKTFAAQPITLDLGNRLLTLETAASYRDRISDMSRLTSRVATGTDGDELDVFVRGEVDAPGWFLLDSGNLDVVQVAPHLGDSEDVWEHVIHVDGMPPDTTSFRTGDIIYDGVLSQGLLRQWLISFDLAANEVWAMRAQ